MGINSHSLSLLIEARRSGVRFDRTLTLGRLTAVLRNGETEEDLRRLVGDAGFAIDPCDDWPRNGDGKSFADPLLMALGAREIVALDASSYEGASVTHDLNEPMDLTDLGGFDLVLDGGTLEHVFNLPVALKSVMELVKVGGHLILQPPLNNLSGHGFYQLSPEFFFRSLSDDQGYRIVRALAYARHRGSGTFSLVDPATLGTRAVLWSLHRLQGFVLAQRMRAVEVFQVWPQQSDYVSAWSGSEDEEIHTANTSGVGLHGIIRRLLSGLMRWRNLQPWLESTVVVLSLVRNSRRSPAVLSTPVHGIFCDGADDPTPSGE